MKTWQDLSPEQQHFLKSFLKTSVLDIVRDKYKTETNKGIIAAFGQFADMEALFVERAALVPDDYPEKAGPMDQADTARDRKAAGAFEDATKRMAPAIQAMEKVRFDLTTAADALRANVGPVAGVGFPDDATARIEQARQAVMQHLGDPLPTYAQMGLARAALPAYENAVNDAYGAAGELPAAQAALTKAADAANARLDEIANMDITVFNATPQAGDLASAVQKAKDLQAAIGTVDRTDAGAMRTLAGELDGWVILDAAQTLIDAATLAVIAQVQAVYDDARESIDDAVDLDPTEYDGEPEEAALKKTHGELVAERQSHLAIIATGDPVEVLKLIPLIIETERKAIDFYDLTVDIDVRRDKARYQSLGASSAQADGIVKLLDENEDAGTAVLESLQRNSAILGGAEATRDYIDNKGAEVKTLTEEIDTIGEEWRVANADRTTKQTAYDTALANHAQEQQRVTALGTAATQEDRAGVEALRLVTVNLYPGYIAAFNLQNEKSDDYSAKKTEKDLAEKHLNAAKSQRAMLDAVTFGPLSPLAAHPIPDDLLEDVVKLFDQNYEIAVTTCALAPNAKDPKALAETALLMAAQSDTGFEWTPPTGSDGVTPDALTLSKNHAQLYASNVLRQTAYFGADFASEVPGALAKGLQHNRDARILNADSSVQGLAAARAIMAAESMITRSSTGVKLDLDSPAFNDMLQERRHALVSLLTPTVTLTEQMGELQDFFGDPDKGAKRRSDAEAILNSVTTVPSNPQARTLLSAQMGIDPDDFDKPEKAEEIKQKIQIGILKAVTTPITQGAVGSCFATGPLRKLQNDNPVALMEMYRDIATKGTFIPKHGFPVMAPVDLPKGDDQMARSLEYAIATAAARTKNSREKTHVATSMFDPSEPSLAGLENEVDAQAWLKLKPALQEHVLGGYTFRYDPMVAAGGVSADGNSTKGVYKMVALDTKAEITSQSEFVAYVKRKALAAIAAATLPDTDRDKIIAYIDEPAFINGIDKLVGDDKPWQMLGGGWADSAGAVLFEEEDGTKRPEEFRGSREVRSRSSDTVGERAVKVLKALTSIGGGEMTTVTTSGIHTFNALEPTGAFAALSDPPGFDQNVQEQLVDPGIRMATEKLPADRAAYLYGKRIDSVMRYAHDEAESDLIKAAYATPPTTDMTPAELETYITTKLEPWKTASVNRKANAWTAKQNPLPAPSKIREQKDKLLAAENNRQKDAVTAMMATELGAPEFVIADSNWGDSSDRKLFVIAPDPLTGEARMWQKSAVDGSIYPMEDKWLKTSWYKDE